MSRSSKRWMLVGLGVLAGTGAVCRAAYSTNATSDATAGAAFRHPVHDGSRVLAAGNLVVEVMDPSDPQRYNCGVRFTPVAAVLGARLGGREFLYNPVAHNPVNDHGGLAAEFDLVTPDDGDDVMPPGYGDARVGEGYLKVGVGVLCKQADRYSLFQHPKLLARASTTVTWHPDAADFHQVCPGTNGYAYVLEAVVWAGGDTITVDWTLQNTGRKPFTTRQYVHNFFRFDDCDVGPGYELSFPYGIQVSGMAAEQHVEGRRIVFDARIPQWVNMAVPWPAGYVGPNTCRVEQRAAGMSASCATSMPGLRTAIHARAGYLSPEQFVRLDLAPGERAVWQRRYTFALRDAGGS